MKEDIDLKEIGQKTYRLYYQDGLLDILMGFIILFFGIEMVAEISEISFTVYLVLAFLPISLFFRLKILITYPRIGYIRPDLKLFAKQSAFDDIIEKFRTTKEYAVSLEWIAKERKKEWVLFIGFSLISILCLSIFLIVSEKTGLSLESVNDLGEIIMLIIGVVMVCSMSVTAGLSGARYMYVYTALILIAVVGGHLFNVPRHLRLILPGAVIMLCGIVVLVRFLHKYRIPAEEAPNDKS